MFAIGLLVGAASGAAAIMFSVFLGYRIAQLHAAEDVDE